jgi:hypothetical protein
LGLVLLFWFQIWLKYDIFLLRQKGGVLVEYKNEENNLDGLFEIIDFINKHRGKLVPNKNKLKSANIIADKIKKWIKEEDDEATFTIHKDKLFNCHLIMAVEGHTLEATGQTICLFREIINEVDDIGFTALNSGEVRIAFGINDVFIPEKKAKK